MELKTLIEEYLQEGHVMQLATVAGGQPWVCTVHYASDEDFNLYWMSLRSRRHSKELAQDSHAGVAIAKNPEETRGIQMAGEAIKLSGQEAERAHAVYSSKFGDKPERLVDALSDNEEDRAYYVFRPREIVLFDTVNFPDNPRQEYKK